MRFSSTGGLVRSLGLSSLLLGTVPFTNAQIKVSTDSEDSLRTAASTAAHGMMANYKGNLTGQVPGLLPDPYFWWECGSMFMSLIEYWSLTGDDTYNDVVKQGMLFQVGEDKDYMPSNESFNEANDDQAFWGFAAMTAAELTFPNPDPDQPQWLALAQAVFNRIAVRWDAATCGGGFRWQYNPTLNGINYKNAISNGAFFQLGSRLARYTGNESYANWAEKTFEWMEHSPIMEQDANGGWIVWDGVDIPGGCKNVHEARFSYNFGTLISGAAYLYDYYSDNPSKQQQWLTTIKDLITGAQVLFPDEYGGNVLSEIQCEQSSTCDFDSSSFKAYTTRWLTMAAIMVDDDDVRANIKQKLISSAEGAGPQCSGTDNLGNTVACGERWWQTEWDGTYGVGQQMSAMSVFANNLVRFVGPIADSGSTDNNNGHGIPIKPLSMKTGATSKGDPNAGTTDGATLAPLAPITTGDKAGAGILTTLVLAATLYLTYFLTFAKDK